MPRIAPRIATVGVRGKGLSVKILLPILLILLYACGKPKVTYQDAHLTITGAIEVIEEPGSEDGGTRYLKARVEADVVHDIFISHRLGQESEWGTVFAHAYMD